MCEMNCMQFNENRVMGVCISHKQRKYTLIKGPSCEPLGDVGVEAAGKYLLFCFIPGSGACGTANGLLLISHAACLQ